MTKKLGIVRMVLAVAAVGVLAASPTIAYANTVIDLTTAGSTSGVTTSASGDDFIVTQFDPSATGTGLIDSFLRIQQTGSERGYNTDTNGVLDNKDGAFTHAITLGEVQAVTVGGVSYLQFILDINQTLPNALLSLNQVQLFVAGSDPGAGCTVTEASAGNFATITGGCGTLAFQMSNNTVGTDYELQLNYALNSGSGSGDYFFLVEQAAFAGFSSDDNLILFAQFGSPNGAYSSNDGFEEFWVTCPAGDTTCGPPPPPPPPDGQVPEPASLLLFGSALIAGGMRIRKSGRR